MSLSRSTHSSLSLRDAALVSSPKCARWAVVVAKKIRATGLGRRIG